jgi:hypothetical protein
MSVLVYLGVGISSHPTRLPDALAEYVGSDRAPSLQKRVDALLREAWLDPSEWVGKMDLAAATEEVSASVRRSHPELSDDAVRALAWNFAYASR